MIEPVGQVIPYCELVYSLGKRTNLKELALECLSKIEEESAELYKKLLQLDIGDLVFEESTEDPTPPDVLFEKLPILKSEIE